MLPVLAALVKLLALALPVLGTALMVSRLAHSTSRKAWGWSAGHPPRRALLALATAGLAALLAWAWWPSGQYQPVRPTDNGTLLGLPQTFTRAPAQPAPAAAAPAPAVAAKHTAAAKPPARLAPGRHVAIALIPTNGASKDHPAILVVQDGKRPAAVIVVSRPRRARARRPRRAPPRPPRRP